MWGEAKMKELTKEDFQLTKWKVTPAQGKRLLVRAMELKATPDVFLGEIRDFQLIFFPEKNNYFADTYYKSDASEEELQKQFDYYPGHKQRDFDDYFEPIVMDVVPTVKIKKSHEEGGVKVIDDAELVSLNAVKHPEAVCRIQEESLNEGCSHIEGSFAWAVHQMKHGKKVRMSSWVNDDAFIKRDGEEFIDDSGKIFAITFAHVIMNNWEIYEEKKSLSDKAWTGVCFTEDDKEHYLEEDVKKAVSNLKKELFNQHPPIIYNEIAVSSTIKQIFGERLTE